MNIDFEIEIERKNDTDSVKQLINDKINKTERKVDGSKLLDVVISDIAHNPFQPRRSINQDSIMELASSIKQEGLLQPVGLIKTKEGYVLRYGHRRLEAFKMLKKETISAIVVEDDNKGNSSLLATALIENLQRDDMEIMDIALSFRSALDSQLFESQSELARSIGKERVFVSRVLKFLDLPDVIIEDLINNSSIRDTIALDAIRRIDNDENAIEIYFWYIESTATRADLLRKINALCTGENNPLDAFEITESTTGYTLDIPKLDSKNMKKLESYISKLIKNSRAGDK